MGIQSNDRQNITVGNPKIQPEFINTAELSYSQNFGRLSWFASAYYMVKVLLALFIGLVRKNVTPLEDTR